MATDTGGPAYPTPKRRVSGGNGVYGPGGYAEETLAEPGMTWLDRFALAAMQGMLANPNSRGTPLGEIIVTAYQLADLALAEKRRREAER